MHHADLALAVIGGTGVYRIAELEDVQSHLPETRYGFPSGPVRVGRIAGQRVAFLARHGEEHGVPPHKINYRANLWAMKELGVQRIVGPCAAGSLQIGVKIGDFVVCDQIVDRTRSRPHTFYDGPVTTHISFADPYCATMRPIIVDKTRELGIGVHDGGTMVVIEGPRFSTRAESRMFATVGGDVIGMTQFPEAALAKELELCFANVALVTDYDVGVDGIAPVSHAEVLKVFGENIDKLRDLLFAAIPRVPDDRSGCDCAHALGGSGHD